MGNLMSLLLCGRKANKVRLKRSHHEGSKLVRSERGSPRVANANTDVQIHNQVRAVAREGRVEEEAGFTGPEVAAEPWQSKPSGLASRLHLAEHCHVVVVEKAETEVGGIAVARLDLEAGCQIPM